MKPLRLPLIGIAIAIVFSPNAGAQLAECSWTNVDGTTLWARLLGCDRSHIFLVKGRRHYRVPIGRLSRGSIEKAHRMLEREFPDHISRRIRDMAGAKPFDAVPASSAGGRGSLPSPGQLTVTTSSSATNRQLHLGGPARERIRLRGRHVIPPKGIPSTIGEAIHAANRLQAKPYRWGGGHARVEDSGYDCSGSVSYVLIKAGLLRSPGTSRSFTRYGKRGPGRWITIYAKNGHVFMTICGLRFDTGGHGGQGESGPRWRPGPRSTRGFIVRHPAGF